jgi:hypothetical protein
MMSASRRHSEGEIFLMLRGTENMRISAAGVTFENRQRILLSLWDENQRRGLPLTGTLHREPDNKYDRNAIQIRIEGMPIGYVPKQIAARLAPKMDAGIRIEVCAVEVVYGGDGSVTFGARLDLRIHMKTSSQGSGEGI